MKPRTIARSIATICYNEAQNWAPGSSIECKERMADQVEAFLAEVAASTSVLSESSPKSVSVSVPAVAGGGEDARRLDWLDAQRQDIVQRDGNGDPELLGYGWGIQEQANDVRTAIDMQIEQADRAAIAATKAKEESPWKPKLNS